jgi:hypothetical protein
MEIFMPDLPSPVSSMYRERMSDLEEGVLVTKQHKLYIHYLWRPWWEKKLHKFLEKRHKFKSSPLKPEKSSDQSTESLSERLNLKRTLCSDG